MAAELAQLTISHLAAAQVAGGVARHSKWQLCWFIGWMLLHQQPAGQSWSALAQKRQRAIEFRLYNQLTSDYSIDDDHQFEPSASQKKVTCCCCFVVVVVK